MCLEDSLPGKDCVSISMHKMMEYKQELDEAFSQVTNSKTADACRNKAEWARFMAAEIQKQSHSRDKEVCQSNGEAVPADASPFRDTLAIPDLAAVEASFERSRLLLGHGADVAAMALDAATSIQAKNSLEKMLAHQLAAIHKVVLEQLACVSYCSDAAAQAKRLGAAARCMIAYQQGILALHKMRRNGNQHIMVQYVNVSDGSQAVIGNIHRSGR